MNVVDYIIKITTAFNYASTTK